MKSVNILLDERWTLKASNLYITVGAPIFYRVDGEIKTTHDPLSKQDVSLLIRSMMSNDKHNEYT